MCLGYLQQIESDIKAKIEGYTLVPNEQAHQQVKCLVVLIQLLEGRDLLIR